MIHECPLMTRNVRDKYLRTIDEFLIDINEEMLDLSEAINDDSDE